MTKNAAMRHDAITAALIMAAVAIASTARSAGERPRVALVYELEDGIEQRCPGESELVARLAAELGYDPIDPDAPSDLEVSIGLDETGSGLRGAWRVRNPGTEAPERSLRAAPSECDELVASLALSISVVLDRIARDQDAAAPRPQPNAPEASPSRSSERWTEPPPPSFDAPTDPLPADEARPGIHVVVTLGGHGAAGTSPKVTAGVTGGAGVWLDPVSFRVEARADLETSQIDDAGHGASVQLYAGSAVPCLHVGLAEACGVVTLGSLDATNVNLSGPPSESSFYAAAGVRPGILIPLTPSWLLGVHGELMATLTPVEVRSAGTEIWALSPVSGSFGSGFLIRYP